MEKERKDKKYLEIQLNCAVFLEYLFFLYAYAVP